MLAQIRKVALAPNSVGRAKEGQGLRYDSHVHCANGYENGSASDCSYASGDGGDCGDGRSSENVHVDGNDGLVPLVQDQGAAGEPETYWL
jgi:hypothetical protein